MEGLQRARACWCGEERRTTGWVHAAAVQCYRRRTDQTISKSACCSCIARVHGATQKQVGDNATVRSTHTRVRILQCITMLHSPPGTAMYTNGTSAVLNASQCFCLVFLLAEQLAHGAYQRVSPACLSDVALRRGVLRARQHACIRSLCKAHCFQLLHVYTPWHVHALRRCHSCTADSPAKGCKLSGTAVNAPSVSTAAAMKPYLHTYASCAVWHCRPRPQRELVSLHSCLPMICRMACISTRFTRTKAFLVCSY